MKTWKLVSGILSIVLFFMVAFQSCAAGLSNSLSETGEVSGSAGIIVAIMLLAGGIVSIATRKGSKGGNIALIVLFGIATFFGYCLLYTSYPINITQPNAKIAQYIMSQYGGPDSNTL